LCRFEAIGPADDGETFVVDPLRCEGCGVCVRFCPDHAIDFPERTNGEWFVSRTRHGPLVHARLTPGGENSGKLVTLVRERAREIARESGRDLLIVDGPPGIGCPVIAALADATVALVVTEPTQAALHDLRRVVELARYFDIPAWVCINKHDLAAEMQRHIEAYCELHDLPIVGKIPYDPQITAAQIARTSVVELDSPPSAIGLRAMWARVKDMLP
jgi:MinD superfamily P-loop ATPase